MILDLLKGQVVRRGHSEGKNVVGRHEDGSFFGGNDSDGRGLVQTDGNFKSPRYSSSNPSS